MENIVKETSLLERTGVFDEDAKRRFELRLTYNGMKGKKILVVGINPASNNIQVFDNTTNYLLNNLGVMGYSEIVVWNMFAEICVKLKPGQTIDNADNIEYHGPVHGHGPGEQPVHPGLHRLLGPDPGRYRETADRPPDSPGLPGRLPGILRGREDQQAGT